MKFFSVILLFILTAAVMLAGCQSEKAADINLVTEGKTNYTIVRSDLADQENVRPAMTLRSYLMKRGIELSITTDWEGNPTTDYEIIVGKTARENEDFYIPDRRYLGEEGFVIKVIENKILITGGGNAGTTRGVEYFMTEFLGYNGDTDTTAPLSELSLPGDFEYIARQDYPIKKIELNGVSLEKFRIACDDTGDKSQMTMAEDVQATIYEHTGIWLDIIGYKDKGNGNIVYLSQGKLSKAGVFELSLENGDLVAATDVNNGISRGLLSFFSEIINSKSTEFLEKDGYVYMNDKIQYIYYSEYGAVGDGVTDDFDAIIKAHEAANSAGLNVRADAGATYYIGGANKTAKVQTDTDWGDAKFIIDDTKVENRGSHIFNISSKLASTSISTVKTLEKNQKKLDFTLQYDSFIVVTDKNTLRYIREGLNQNDGSAQTDVFVADKNGNVDMNAPIIWNYENISSMTAYPVDSETMTIKGGRFTTVANGEESKYNYYSRGISVTRSNVLIDGIYHEITGEGDQGAPYGGFISVSNCTDVTVQNCLLSGHKIYSTIGSANSPVSMGSYDIQVNRSTNVTFKDCKQINDIHDTKRWGIFASNYSKNITFDGVEFSRFDAHMGVVNVTIKNSLLGHQGINIIGSGVFLIENTKVSGTNFINMRSDYGSTWEGEIIIRNCEYVPKNGAASDAVIVSGSYSGKHDFGYTCYMPAKITIDGLIIDDRNAVSGYTGPKLLAAFNNSYVNDAFVEKYPYVLTDEIVIKNLTTLSGKPYKLSNNTYMFRNVKVIEKNER